MKNKSIFYFIFCILFSSRTLAQLPAEGPNSPSTVTVIPLPGSYATWSNATNVFASDNLYASYGTMPGAVQKFTDYLQATNFGFSINPLYTIAGILVEVERSDPGGNTSDFSVRIVKNGSIGATELANPNSYSLSDNIQTYGGLGEFWGETWTAADVNASDFGVAIAAKKRVSGNPVSAGRIDHIRIFVIYDDGSLPLKMESFEGKHERNQIRLSWVTTDESSMKYFQVEKSTDLSNFRQIGRINCRNQSSRQYYSHLDQNPDAGVNYYRLKIAEESGAITYSKIVAIRTTETNKIPIFPSVLSNHSEANIQNRQGQNLKIHFYSQTGKLLSKTITNTSSVKVHLPEGTKGIIYYNIENTDLGEQSSGTLYIR
jgi:hypothetical protein